MRILFLTYFYYDIYKPILREMQRQGHDVTIIEDNSIPNDLHADRLKGVRGRVKRLIGSIVFPKPQEKYWKGMLKEHPEINRFYDVLVCQPGLSFCPYLLHILKNNNPNIKSCVMVHDSASYYDFYFYKNLYDRVYTFDYKDALEIEGVRMLGAYWVPTEKKTVKYDVVLIGSDHDDRFEIVNKVYPQLKAAGINSFIRIVSLKPEKKYSRYVRFRLFLSSLLHNTPSKMEIWSQKMKQPFVTDKPIPVDQVNEIISSSKCILETDREGQSGVTLRDMWALASGKKIITTNHFLRGLPFYNAQQITFIDRNNPIIDIDFIKRDESFEINEQIISQRIDNWVARLLDFNN
jgi:hypothetical protein